MIERKSQKATGWINDRNQYIAAIAGALLPFSSGCIAGWVSPAISKLSSVDTPLQTGPLSTEEISWIGSISYAGALIGTISSGYILSHLGSKRTMHLIAIPFILFWSTIYFGTNIHHILIARVIFGFATGFTSTAFLLYITEISSDSIRGRLACVIPMASNTGIVIGYVFGATIDYRQIPIICIFVPIIFVVTFQFLPNTPRYYLHTGQIKEAKSALKWYTGYTGQSEEETFAFNKHFSQLKLAANEKESKENWNLSIFCNRIAMKRFLLCIILILFSQFTATSILEKYAVTIFARTGTTLNPYKCSIILAITHVIGAFLVIGIVEKIGRKTCLVIYFLTSATGLLTTSIFLSAARNGYDLSNYAWAPVVCLCFVVFFSSFSMSMTYSTEYLPTQIRTIGLVAIFFVMNVNAFVFAKVFPILMQAIGLDACLIILAAGCILASLYVIFALEETRGKSIHDDIKANVSEVNDFREIADRKIRY